MSWSVTQFIKNYYVIFFDLQLHFEWQLHQSCQEFCTTQNHKLHSDHHHTSEKIYWCHSMMINIDCHDEDVDLKIESRSFCSCKKDDKKNKIVWEWQIWSWLAMTVLMQTAAAVSFASQTQQQTQKQVHKKTWQWTLKQVQRQTYRQML